MATEIIFINGRFLSQRITGVQRVALELLTQLDKLFRAPNTPSLVLLVPKNTLLHPVFKNIDIKVVGRMSGHLWEQTELPFYSRRGLLLNLCNAAPLLKRNQIATIHDMAVFRKPEAFSFSFRNWYRVMFYIVSRRARFILTVSQFSRSEIEAVLDVSPQKIKVVANGKEHILRTEVAPDLLSRFSLEGRPFVLAVSSLNPYKNFQAVVRAFEHLADLDFDLVIAGGSNPQNFATNDLPLPRNVKYLGYVTDQELRALYGAAKAFIFPSLYEGFGLPPLEAMACGCPVIMSNRASLPEVGGDAVLYVDPYDIEGIADAIRRMVSDDDLRNKFRALGFAQADKFSWDKTAKEVQNILQTFL